MWFKKDYSEYKPEKLPTNRKEQFFDTLKHNIPTLLLIGFIFLLFCLPILVSVFVRDFYFAAYLSAYQKEEITAEQLTSLTRSLLKTMNIVISCCYIFLSVPVAGISKIMRRFIWSEQVFFLSDFFTGIMENILKTLVFSVILAASIYGLYSLKTISNLPWFLEYMPYGVFAIIILPFFLHFMVLMNIYSQPIGKTIMNSFMMYFKTPFLTILFAVLPLISIYLIGLIGYIGIWFLVHALMIVVFLPIYLLLWFTYEISFLDKRVNEVLFPEIYKKGLYVDKSDS